MIDVNERAVELSNENAEKNGIKNVRIYQSDLFSNIDSAQTFASIITNPPIRAGKKVVGRRRALLFLYNDPQFT